MSIIAQEWLDKYPDLVAKVRNKNDGLRGYPCLPGTGPKSETCSSCANIRLMQNYAKRYYKCVCRAGVWTHGAATDVKYRSPACSYWRVRWEREHFS